MSEANDVMRRLADGEGWKGTEPAEGTRRALVRDTIEEELSLRHVSTAMALGIADAIESALLKSTIAEEAEGIHLDKVCLQHTGTEERAGDAARRMARELIEARERADRLHEEREQAHASEDAFKAQRDASLNLLRWLIGDLLPSPASFPPGGPDPDALHDGLAGIEDRLSEIVQNLNG